MTEKVNDTDTTVGGYYNSKMNLTYLGSPAVLGDLNGTINQQLYYYFGDHLKTYRDILSNAIDENAENMVHTETGATKTWNWYPVQCVLMSEAEVYGTNVWSSSGLDTGCAKTQYPAFRLSERMLNPRIWFWLKNVVSKTKFAVAPNYGYADRYNASGIHTIRPRFILA